MPRLARLDGLGVLHHVMARGIGRRKIFLEDGDHENDHLMEPVGDHLLGDQVRGLVIVLNEFVVRHAHHPEQSRRGGPLGSRIAECGGRSPEAACSCLRAFNCLPPQRGRQARRQVRSRRMPMVNLLMYLDCVRGDTGGLPCFHTGRN